jgi:hypothetical protein
VKLHGAIAVALAGLALSLFAAPAAGAVRSEFFGIDQGHPLLDDTDLDSLATTGVKTARILLAWKSIEPTRGHRDWTATDQLVGELSSRGIRAVPMLWGSPSWTRTGGYARPPLNTASAKGAWQSFLKAAVARYGTNGSYWANGYRNQYGQSVAAFPIRAWQVWNEPNLRHLFDPGASVGDAARKYDELLRISHDAIRSADGQAQIVLAGLATQKDLHAFDFLAGVYSSPGIKRDFDVVATHPYASSVDKVRAAVQKVRKVMANNGDQAKPLWITEFGWASAPPDEVPSVRVGLAGQARLLGRTYTMFLNNRAAWKLERLFWYQWRDPQPDSPGALACGFCGTSGLLDPNGIAKPALGALVQFTADAVPPTARINFGPLQGGTTSDPTPTFKFYSSEAGSTFRCGFDAKPLAPCSSPFTPTMALASGPHVFSVEATDAAGNVSALATRSFTVGP